MRRVAIAAFVVASACGTLPTEELPADPVAVVEGQVDVAALRASDGPLRVALAWSIPAITPSACSEVEPPPALAEKFAAYCGDPFRVGVQPSAPSIPLVVDADGRFSFPLQALPRADFTVQVPGGRFGYGTLVVFVDRDGSGTLSPAFSNSGSAPVEGAPESDRVLGASFASIIGAQDRLILREGAWDPFVSQLFHPAVGCATPSPGFSVLRTEQTLRTDFPDQIDSADDILTTTGCELLPTTTPLVVRPLSETEALTLECSVARFGWWANPEWFEEPFVSPPECLDPEKQLAIFFYDDVCGHAEVVALRSCFQSGPDCETPEWDYTASPPPWWPCPPPATP